MNAYSKVRAMPSARAGAPSERSPQAVSGKAAIPIAIDVNLTEIMEREGIRTIHRDTLLEHYSVTLLDYSMGLGGTVGQALRDARRRAA